MNMIVKIQRLRDCGYSTSELVNSLSLWIGVQGILQHSRSRLTHGPSNWIINNNFNTLGVILLLQCHTLIWSWCMDTCIQLRYVYCGVGNTTAGLYSKTVNAIKRSGGQPHFACETPSLMSMPFYIHTHSSRVTATKLLPLQDLGMWIELVKWQRYLQYNFIIVATEKH